MTFIPDLSDSVPNLLRRCACLRGPCNSLWFHQEEVLIYDDQLRGNQQVIVWSILTCSPVFVCRVQRGASCSSGLVDEGLSIQGCCVYPDLMWCVRDAWSRPACAPYLDALSPQVLVCWIHTAQCLVCVLSFPVWMIEHPPAASFFYIKLDSFLLCPLWQRCVCVCVFSTRKENKVPVVAALLFFPSPSRQFWFWHLNKYGSALFSPFWGFTHRQQRGGGLSSSLYYTATLEHVVKRNNKPSACLRISIFLLINPTIIVIYRM